MTVQTTIATEVKPRPSGNVIVESPAAIMKVTAPVAITANNMNVYYGNFRAVRDINLPIEARKITALIGPSGCGKSTVLRSFNRMNDLIASARVEGEVLFEGRNIYAPEIDPVEVRRRIGMVFQKPNPFPKSIYENVAWGARINGFNGKMDELVEQSLRGRRCGMR